MTKEEFEILIKPLNLLEKVDREFMITALTGNFKNYHKSKVENLGLANVSHRRELFKLKEFAERQQNIPEDIQKIVNDNWWDLI